MENRATGSTPNSGPRAARSHPRLESSWWPLVAIVLLAILLPSGAEPATVTGSVNVSRASLRTEGPKHDLDVVLALSPLRGGAAPPSTAAATMDQQGLVFLPHVLAIQKGTTVTFLNNDNDDHNVYFLDDNTGETLDIGTWGPGVSVDHTFTTPGMVITLCKLHLEMAAYIVVLDHPWFTQVRIDPDTMSAPFSIRDVPEGDYLLTAWHKKLKQKGGSQGVGVTGGESSAGEVVITPARYAREK